MLNRYPLWKYLLILVVLIGGLVYSLPNLFPEDPAVQISSARGDATVDERELERIQASLREAGIEIKAIESAETSVLIRLDDADDQINARDRITALLGDDYVVALNLAESTPTWLQALSASPMALGLDLRGGVHFLLEVDMDAALEQRLEVNASAMRELLRGERIRYRDTEIDGRTLSIIFTSAEDRDTARRLISRAFPDFEYASEGEDRGARLVMTMTDQAVNDLQDYGLDEHDDPRRSTRDRLSRSGARAGSEVKPKEAPAYKAFSGNGRRGRQLCQLV